MGFIGFTGFVGCMGFSYAVLSVRGLGGCGGLVVFWLLLVQGARGRARDPGSRAENVGRGDGVVSRT